MYKDSILAEDYGYDPKNGIRISETNTERSISGKGYSYSDENHLLTAGNATYRHDSDGFLEKKTDASGDTLYDYSSRGELLSVTLPDSTFIEYVHDPYGRRIAKKKDSVIVEKYLWKDRTRLLAVYDGSNNLKMGFEYADGRMPVTMTADDSSVYYLTYDQVGSLRIVTDASGTVVRKVDCDSFGNIYFDSNPASEVPFGFAGGLHDRNTGLVRFGYRDYDPDAGRWTAKDPILFKAGDADIYGYCLNDPVNWIDPWGLVRNDGIKRFPCQKPLLGEHGGGSRGFPNIRGWFNSRNNTPSSALKNSPYHPGTVRARVKPPYRANPAHDPACSRFNPKKTPEPGDAVQVYKNSVRSGMGEWYGIGKDGQIYRYFSDNAGGVHFSGIVQKSSVPTDVRKQLGLSHKGN